MVEAAVWGEDDAEDNEANKDNGERRVRTRTRDSTCPAGLGQTSAEISRLPTRQCTHVSDYF